MPYTSLKALFIWLEEIELKNISELYQYETHKYFIFDYLQIGRSRQHQGLAAAIVKLWERSSIAKVALKRGVQLTTSERMAEDIKVLNEYQIK